MTFERKFQTLQTRGIGRAKYSTVGELRSRNRCRYTEVTNVTVASYKSRIYCKEGDRQPVKEKTDGLEESKKAEGALLALLRKPSE
jgi:hypothetical protein